ncbi:hypothetical protein HPB47_013936, partial [Ixodes persulcatus]
EKGILVVEPSPGHPQPHLEWYKPLPSLTEGRILVRQGPPKRIGVGSLRPLKPSCLEVGEFLLAPLKAPGNSRAPASVVKRRKTELQTNATSNVVTEDPSAGRAEPGIAACTAGDAEADTVEKPSTHVVLEDDSMNDIPVRVPAKPSRYSVPVRSVLPEKSAIVMQIKSWACHEVDVEGLQNLCCVEMKSTSAIEPPFTSKILTLEQCQKSLKVCQRVLDREVNSVLLQAECPSQSAHDITEMVHAFDQKPVCAGGPAYKMFPGETGSLGGVVALETLNVWVTVSGIHGGEAALRIANAGERLLLACLGLQGCGPRPQVPVPTYTDYDDRKSVADFLAQLAAYKLAAGASDEYVLARVLPVALHASAARWWRIVAPFLT